MPKQNAVTIANGTVIHPAVTSAAATPLITAPANWLPSSWRRRSERSAIAPAARTKQKIGRPRANSTTPVAHDGPFRVSSISQVNVNRSADEISWNDTAFIHSRPKPVPTRRSDCRETSSIVCVIATNLPGEPYRAKLSRRLCDCSAAVTQKL